MVKESKIDNRNKLKVLEYGDVVSASYCGKLLADLGADVIKVEEPGTGDSARRWGPFKSDVPDQEGSGLFLYLNSNKRGITLNLNTSTGKELFKQLPGGHGLIVIKIHCPDRIEKIINRRPVELEMFVKDTGEVILGERCGQGKLRIIENYIF